MMMKRLFAVAAMVALSSTPIAAQGMGAGLADDFERQRANVLGMVDAMPATGLRTAPTEGVRDFAQQIEHVVQGNLGIISSGYDRPMDIPEMSADVYLNSKDELKTYVNAGYDLINEMITNMSESDLHADAQLFGQATVPTWKLVQTAYEHAVWTLGATVPYVRMNGGTPPGYDLVPGSR